MTDPWKHRSVQMRCASCMWYVPKHAPEENPEIVAKVGRCRRHAPRLEGFPVVFRDDWCGDHKLNEVTA